MTSELLQKSKEELILHFQSRESRLRMYKDESFSERLKQEQQRITNMERELKVAFPLTTEWSKHDLFFYNDLQREGKFAIAKRDKFNCNYYLLGRQVFPLPDEYKIKDLPVIFLAYFDYKRRWCNWGMITKYARPLMTFHTDTHHICLGESSNTISDIPKLDKPSTIVDAFNKIKEVLDVINPYSYLNVEGIPDNQRKIVGYIHEKKEEHERGERRIRRANRRCQSCSQRISECTEERCDNCDYHRDRCECDGCSNCDSVGGCNCTYCEICDSTNSDWDGCGCNFCYDCNYRFDGGTTYVECTCDICDRCDNRGSGCNCATCSQCGQQYNYNDEHTCSTNNSN